MRGTHLMLGRQDYTGPEALSSEHRERAKTASVAPRSADRSKPHHWHTVSLNGTCVGFVTTRLGGQLFRRTEDTDWRIAAHIWNDVDADHVHAVLALLTEVQEAA